MTILRLIPYYATCQHLSGEDMKKAVLTSLLLIALLITSVLTGCGQPEEEIDISTLAGKIVFSGTSDMSTDAWHIFTMNADGTNIIQITEGDGGIAPAWSPDGQQIAYLSGGKNLSDNPDHHVYVMSADGSTYNRITSAPSFLTERCSWSRAGDSIMYDGYYSTKLVEVEAPPSGTPAGNKGSWILGKHPSWSPVTDKVAVIFPDYKNYASLQLYVIEVDSMDRTPLTNVMGSKGWPSWSPDGTEIVYHGEKGGNWDIYVVDSDGGIPKKLTSNPESDVFPVWSPGGKYIVYSSYQDGSPRLWMMNADGSSKRVLVNTEMYALYPSWKE